MYRPIWFIRRSIFLFTLLSMYLHLISVNLLSIKLITISIYHLSIHVSVTRFWERIVWGGLEYVRKRFDWGALEYLRERFDWAIFRTGPFFNSQKVQQAHGSQQCHHRALAIQITQNDTGPSILGPVVFLFENLNINLVYTATYIHLYIYIEPESLLSTLVRSVSTYFYRSISVSIVFISIHHFSMIFPPTLSSVNWNMTLYVQRSMYIYVYLWI